MLQEGPQETVKAQEFYTLRAERDAESDLVAAAFIYISMEGPVEPAFIFGLTTAPYSPCPRASGSQCDLRCQHSG